MLEPRFDPESKRDRTLWRRRIERSEKPLGVSLWSGAGGLDLGLSHAGFDIAIAADSDEWACRTHGHNSDALVFRRDLDDPEQTRMWLRSLDLPQISLVAGGFPCQPYSRAGYSVIRHLVASRKRSAVDHRAFAWKSFVAAVDELRPDHAIAENVPDMARFNDGQLLRDIVESLEALGYEVDVRILVTRRFGVPQFRERLIIQATVSEIGVSWPLEPSDTQEPSVLSAIGDLPSIAPGGADEPVPYIPNDRQSPPSWARDGCQGVTAEVLYDHFARDVRADDSEAFQALRPGGTYLEIPKALRRYDDGQFKDKYKRLEWDRPSRTITAHIARDGYWYIHPAEHRTLSIREAARLQTFPDWFVFAGFPSNRYSQIGNAVPPLLGRAIGQAILARRARLAPRSHVPPATTLLEKAAECWTPRGHWEVLVAEGVFGGRAGVERLTAMLERFPAAEDARRCRNPADEHEIRARDLADGLAARFGGLVPTDAGELERWLGMPEALARVVVSLVHGNHVPRSTGTVRLAERVSGVSRSGGLNGVSQVVLARLAAFGSDPVRNQLLVHLGRYVCLRERPRCRSCALEGSCAYASARTSVPSDAAA